jgi:diguanylate cyclase (GGDEF)-like protein
VLTTALCLGAVALIVVLQQRNGDDRDAELSLVNAQAALTQLQSAPYGAVAGNSGYARRETRFAREEIAGGKETVDSTLAELRQGSPPPELERITPLLQANYATVDEIYELGATGGDGARADVLGMRAGKTSGQINELMTAAGAKYHQRAERSDAQSIAGSAAMIALLLVAFAFFHTRSDRLQRERKRLLAASREEALTDALTGLGNRRALINDLEREVAAADEDSELVLALFDLDGFKRYNDTFGHPAGDALLSRLGARLADAVAGAGTAYRMGGDEFCVLADLNRGGGEAVQRGAEALSESGEAFEVGCSYGSVVLPSEVSDATEALRVSDQRMYRNKAFRRSPNRQSIDVLVKVLDERNGALAEHVQDVAQLARLTGRKLGLPENELARLYAAAELHDIGKSAIPDAVLNKPGKLTPEEFEFIRQHTLIGERIVLAAPSLAHTGELIRSSHERVDGTGYPDGLSGDQIPLGARIIAVCDAYDAMTAERSYARALSHEEALAEILRCSGTQFDAAAVDAFAAVVGRTGTPHAKRQVDDRLG